MAKGPGLLHYTAHRALTLGEHLQILSKRRGGMYESGICDTKPAISLKTETKWSRAKVTYRVPKATRIRAVDW